MMQATKATQVQMTKEIKQGLQTSVSPIDKKQVQAGKTQGSYPAISTCNHNFNCHSRDKLPEFQF